MLNTDTTLPNIDAETRNDTHDALLGELESIRTLLSHDAQDDIPLLLPEIDGDDLENIPTLSIAAMAWANENIPLLENIVREPMPLNAVDAFHLCAGEENNTPNVIVESLIDELLPQIETMLRSLLQEKLHQEKPETTAIVEMESSILLQ